MDVVQHLPLARQIAEYIDVTMLGRLALEHDNALIMACFAAVDGDHLEIGTMHGGSAILVAMLKRELGLSGNVTCIDPLDGYYAGTRYACPADPLTHVPVTIETIRENERRFGVKLDVIQAKSIPFPVAGRRFATAYIDGDHWGIAPVMDFINCMMVTERYIIFDNCSAPHPDVMRACEAAEAAWRPVLRQGITCVVEHL